jgi:diguanylate cyclase (GGDEF)-like protein
MNTKLIVLWMISLLGGAQLLAQSPATETPAIGTPAIETPAPLIAHPHARVDKVPRHALEVQALNEPELVLEKLPPLIQRAQTERNFRELALLYLAQANACRVSANWPCQSSAGADAFQSAARANDPVLEIRGLIAEARARIAMQDYGRGEERLSQAELLLREYPLLELQSDVYLAYSSLTYTLGKYELSQEYADRGLTGLPADERITRARLLRNRGRAQANRNMLPEAKESLRLAQAAASSLNDPKLVAELYLESARLAHLSLDVVEQRASADQVILLSRRLKNSQLLGQGQEALGIAALDAKDFALAESYFRQAREGLAKLGLRQDERRVLKQLLDLLSKRADQPEDFDALVAQFLVLNDRMQAEDKKAAADDFDQRLQFLTSEMEVKRLKVEAQASREREKLLGENSRLAYLAAGLFAFAMSILGVFALSLRKNKRFQEKLARTDAMTGMGNRRMFEERIQTAFTRAKRIGKALTLLSLDLDKFKSINDTFGHSVGDGVIIEFSKRIQACLRDSDLPIRLGGDEFVILIEDAQNAEEGAIVAQKILAAMQPVMRVEKQSLQVSCSIGVGYDATPQSIQHLLDLSDSALYAAKAAGRNTYQIQHAQH